MPRVDAIPALCQAVALPDTGPAGQVPEWVHLLPVGTIATQDGRGPYRLDDAAGVIAASLAATGGRLPIDESHATDLALPKGGPAPARGWIVELEARADGIWGRVEWTEAGRALVADRAYRHISPVIAHRKDGRVIAVLRASLVNAPNLRGLAALNSRESDMDVLAALRQALGLADTTDAPAAIAAVKELKAGASAAALQSSDQVRGALSPIAKAAGLTEDADQAAIVGAVTRLAAGSQAGEAVTALQAELKTVTTELNALKLEGAKARATAFVDGEIAKGRVGVKPLRDHYIAMHMADAARVEKELGALPILAPSGATAAPPATDKDGKIALNAEQQAAAKLLGIPLEDYRKTLAAEAAEREEAI